MDFELIQLLKASTGRQDLSTGEIYSFTTKYASTGDSVFKCCLKEFSSKAYCSIFFHKGI